jgi:hypothetical protein
MAILRSHFNECRLAQSLRRINKAQTMTRRIAPLNSPG